jgi:hypothetical protein
MTAERYPDRRTSVEADQKPSAGVKAVQYQLGHKPDRPGPMLTAWVPLAGPLDGLLAGPPACLVTARRGEQVLDRLQLTAAGGGEPPFPPDVLGVVLGAVRHGVAA